jgi:seryl-tRNA synthetase
MDEQGKDFRLEQFRTEYESASKRLADLNAAKRETAARLAEHLEKLPNLPLAKIETWAAERRRLEDAGNKHSAIMGHDRRGGNFWQP